VRGGRNYRGEVFAGLPAEGYEVNVIATFPANSYRGRRKLARLWRRLERELDAKAPDELHGGYREGVCCRRDCCRRFFAGYRDRGIYCSDHCRKRDRHAYLAAYRKGTRAAARAGRNCAHCGAALACQRSTRKFCSAKCRVCAARVRARQARGR
jgi:hypothetical protein